MSDSLVRKITYKFQREGMAGLARAMRSRIQPNPIVVALRKLSNQPCVSIVQVGAYIGPTSNDPIHEFIRARAGNGLQAVLVEPVLAYYDRLKDNYAGLTGVHLENVAIAEASGERDFYRLGVDPRDHGFPEWLEQLGSLKAERMTELWDKYEAEPKLKEFYLRHRIVERVRCVTIMDLVAKHGIQQLDFLQIDAEGYDSEILNSLDFNQVRPTFINYERVLLSREADHACRAMLRAQNYQLVDHGQDTFCRSK